MGKRYANGTRLNGTDVKMSVREMSVRGGTRRRETNV